MQSKEGCPKEEFYRLVNQYQTRLMRMCYMLLKNRQYAEDATQETFLKAFLHYGTLRDKSKEKAWLMAIAINTCRMMLRSRWIKHIQRSLPDPEEGRAFPLPEHRFQKGAAVIAEPLPLRFVIGADARHLGPEPRGVVHLDAVAQLVDHDVVPRLLGREHE